MDSLSDPQVVQTTLAEWAQAGPSKLASAKLSSDGTTLQLDQVSLAAGTVLTVSHAGKTCRYSLGSIFLQLLDPHQGLMPYRSACKNYNIADPIKPLDKPVILGFFLGLATGLASEAAADAAAPPTQPTATQTAAAIASATMPPPSTERPAAAGKPSESNKEPSSRHASHHHKSSKDRDRSKHHDRTTGTSPKRSSSSSHHHHRDPTTASPSSKKSKKAPKGLVTNEQLFDNLNVVVDKRLLQVHHQRADHHHHHHNDDDTTLDALKARQEQIKLALSPAGFDVTPELLQEHQTKTAEILKHEIPVGNSASILRAVNPRKDLSRVLELFHEAVLPSNGKPKISSGGAGTSGSGSRTATTAPGSSGALHSSSGKPARKHLIGKKPIIIVPKGMTAVITLANAHEFLANSRFLPRDVLVQQGKHRSPPTKLTRMVKSTSGSTTGLLEYEIMDNPRKLLSSSSSSSNNTPLEWDRIVAVICLGQSWQFKDWLPPIYNAPATLFAHVFGFYIGMEGDKPPAEVSRWAVQTAKLNRDKRGLDQIACASFWNGLDEFMRVHKPELLPQDL